MKNMTWRHCLLLAGLLWSGTNQASGISIPENQDLTDGTVSIIRPARETTTRPPLTEGDIVILPGGNVQLEAIQPITNSGSISPSAIILSTEPTFWALNQTSSLTHIGDYFDIEVVAFAPLANASPDELVLGFGFNTQLGGMGAAQFLGSTINPLFTDMSTQDGVNLAAAGIAFPGLGLDDVGSLISLAVLHFQAVTAGNLDIAITGDLNDPNQGLIYLTQASLAIQASTSVAISAVPLPATWLLFLPGAGFCLRRFRRKPV